MHLPKRYILGIFVLLLSACTASPYFFQAIYIDSGPKTSWVHIETSSESDVLEWAHFYTFSAYIAPAVAQIDKPLVLITFERISQNSLRQVQQVFIARIQPRIKEVSLLFQLDFHSQYPSFLS